jgi:hypothetical protein
MFKSIAYKPHGILYTAKTHVRVARQIRPCVSALQTRMKHSVVDKQLVQQMVHKESIDNPESFWSDCAMGTYWYKTAQD